MTRREALKLYRELVKLCLADLTPEVKHQAQAITSRFRHTLNAKSVAVEAGRVVGGMGGGGIWDRLESLRQAIDEAWPEE